VNLFVHELRDRAVVIMDRVQVAPTRKDANQWGRVARVHLGVYAEPG